MYSRPRTVRTPWALIAGLLTFGCAGVDPLAEKERENSELRFDNERRRESLIEIHEESAHQRQVIQELDAEKAQLAARSTDLDSSLKAVSEQLAQVTKQRDEVRLKLSETQQLSDRLRDNVDKVKEVASASVGELAELRLKRRELEERTAQLSQSESSLREESSKLGRQVKDLELQLATLQAASTQSPLGAQAQAHEREITALKGENFALQKRLEALSLATDSKEERLAILAGTTASAQQPLVYQEDPAGLFSEFKGLLAHRYEQARSGQIAWDAFDISVVTAVVAILLLSLRLCFRICFARRGSRGQLSEESQDSSTPEVAEESLPIAATGAVEEPVVKRRNTARRRSAFPAVISAKDLESRDDSGVAAAALEQMEESFDLPALASSALTEAPRSATKQGSKTAKAAAIQASELEPAPQEPRKIIGARSWEPEQGVDSRSESEEDDLASTQVIPTFLMTGGEEPVPVAVMPLKSQGAKEKAPSRAPVRPAPQEKVDDRQLLAELKSVINRKFDELMK